MWIPKISNCYIFAYVNRFLYGGKIALGKSDFGWWFHCWYIDKENNIYEYIPFKRIRYKDIRNIFPVRTLLFRGFINYIGRIEKS